MEDRALIEKIARRYPSRWTRGYIHGKMRSDPAYRITLAALKNSALPVLDIGCGMGFLAFYLRECGFTPPILGLDLDGAKIASANEIAASHYADLSFRTQDAAAVNDFFGNVVILDVLQYLDEPQQHRLLAALPSMVAPGGQCLIRGTPRDDSWRFRLTHWDDRAMCAIGWIKNPTIHYLRTEEITAPFIRAGFFSEVRPLWGRTPFNSHLFVFKRSMAFPNVEKSHGEAAVHG